MFETTGVMDEALLQEMKKYLLSPKRKAVLLVLIALLAVFGAAGLAVKIYIWTAAAVVLIVLVLAVLRSAPDKIVKTMLSRMEETNGKREASYTTRLTEEGVSVCNNDTGASACVHYDMIDSLKETKSAYLMITRSRQFIVLFKEERTPDQLLEMLDFLKSKPTQISWEN